MSPKPICSLSFKHCIEASFFMVYSFLCKEKEHWNAPMLSAVMLKQFYLVTVSSPQSNHLVILQRIHDVSALLVSTVPDLRILLF